jgi:hypothetical protein
MVCTPQTCFEVTQYRIDPAKCRQIFGFTPTCDDRPVLATGIDHSGKTGQAIGSDDTTRTEIRFGPTDHRFAGKTWDRSHFNIQWTPFGTERDGRHKRDFILGASSGFAANPFTTELSIVHLDRATKCVVRITFDHRLH